MYAIKKTEVGAQIWLVPIKIVFNILRFRAQLKPGFGGFETRLKFIKFGLRIINFITLTQKS